MAAPRFLRRLLTACVLTCVAGCRSAAPPPAPSVDAAFVSATTAAVGEMGRYDFAAAVEGFSALAASHPASAETSLNLAIARINRQQPDDAAEAERRLRALVDHATLGLRARYTLGLLLLYQGREAEAFPLLSAVASATRDDAFPAYFAGQARLAQAPAEALTWFERAIAVDPLLRSARYGAFQALQRQGRADDATAHLTAFQALERDPRAQLAEFKYTRMGPLADVVFVDAWATPVPLPAGPRFAAATLVAALPAGDRRGASITAADIDDDGALDLFVAGVASGASPNAVLLRRGETWQISPTHPLSAVPAVRAALWGDLDDDGLTDVVLVRGRGRTLIWRQDGPNAWRDVTQAWRAATPAVDAVDGALVDADHDGDLDVVLANATGATALLNNNGNRTFRDIAARAGIAGDGRPAAGLAVADLDGDRDHDLIVLKATPPHDVWLNDRVWQYRRAGAFDGFAATPLEAVLAADLDADGRPELYATGARGLERWRADGDGSVGGEVVVAPGALPRAAAARLAVADTDGNGALELVVATDGAWTVVDVPSDGPARVAERVPAPAGPWTVAVVDAARGPAIVGVDARGVVAWSPGPGRHRFLALGVTGRSQASDQRRSNTSGIGTRVRVRTGSRWTAFDTVRLQSGGGQSLQPTAVGLGGAPRADLVALVWPDGILQTELGLDAGRVHTIQETQRQLSSCPVLFAFDGTATRFVTDLLGVGGIGFFERPGVYSPPFPRESVLMPDGSLGPTGEGRLRLVIGEPMEEVAYLDHVELAAYDLPPGWQLALDERKAIASVPPTGKPLFFREERRPLTARNDRGEDVTAAITEADLRAAPPGVVDARFIGLTARHALELEFAADLERGPGRPVLVADGWVEYPYAQTVFAAWQAQVPFEAPTLEAKGRDGRWRVVAPEFGYPAGMPRRMTLPLASLPAGTRALRLSTTQEIYWDRVAVAYAEASPAGSGERVLPLATATLAEAGFAVRTTGPQRTPAYDYARRLPLWDTRHPRGWYTRFGDVRALISESDDATVILGPGEEVVLEFAAPTAPLAPGWTRRYVLKSRGWCKDMDLYTLDGETVAPLPGRDTAARQQLHATFNTRFEGGQ